MQSCRQLIEGPLALDPTLASRLLTMEQEFRRLTGHDLEVISGFRSRREQDALRQEGRPAAPDALSTHRTCPATGADLRVQGMFPGTAVRQYFGTAAVLARLRWGGGSEPDSRGIPSDWNHVDLGPRTDAVAVAYRDASRGMS